MDRICTRCCLCATYSSKFCFHIFIGNRERFIAKFLRKVIHSDNVQKFESLKTFKEIFCAKDGACISGGGCSTQLQTNCHTQYHQQIVKKGGRERRDTPHELLHNYWEPYGEFGYPSVFFSEDKEKVINAEFTEIETVSRDPTIFSSNRKKFLTTVEKILEDRNNQQYRVRKSSQSFKAKAKRKTYNSKSSVPISHTRRKKNVGNSTTN